MSTDIQTEFEEFHQKNPHVYRALVRMTRRLRDNGHTRFGIELLFAQLRWQSMIQTSGDPFKLNDHYTSRYARLIMDNYPEWEGTFALRGLRRD